VEVVVDAGAAAFEPLEHADAVNTAAANNTTALLRRVPPFRTGGI
jgi:hypothetical protein